MLPPRRNLLAFTAIAVLTCSAATAAETQHWSVHITNDTAVLRVAPNTEARFVQSAISGLQQSGTKNFSLRAAKPGAINDTAQLSYTIMIVDRTAEIDATHDLPYKYLIAAIEKLKRQGITRMKFASPKTTGADATPE